MTTTTLKQFVFWLKPKASYTLVRQKGFTQTVWASTPEEGRQILSSWESMPPFGYTPEFLHEIDIEAEE